MSGGSSSLTIDHLPLSPKASDWFDRRRTSSSFPVWTLSFAAMWRSLQAGF